jgi:hypothetical protein
MAGGAARVAVPGRLPCKSSLPTCRAFRSGYIQRRTRAVANFWRRVRQDRRYHRFAAGSACVNARSSEGEGAPLGRGLSFHAFS